MCLAPSITADKNVAKNVFQFFDFALIALMSPLGEQPIPKYVNVSLGFGIYLSSFISYLSEPSFLFWVLLLAFLLLLLAILLFVVLVVKRRGYLSQATSLEIEII